MPSALSGPGCLAAAALGGLLMAQVLTAPAALAHDELVSSVPADGDELPTSPAAVTLTFGEPVSADFSQVVVTGPDAAAWQVGSPSVDGATLTQPLTESAPAGTYEVAWRVVSTDGHPVSGVFSYVVAGNPATPTAPPTAPSAAPSAGSVPPAGGSQQSDRTTPPTRGEVTASPVAATSPAATTSWWPIIAVLVVLMVALAAGAVVVSRRRDPAGRGG